MIGSDRGSDWTQKCIKDDESQVSPCGEGRYKYGKVEN